MNDNEANNKSGAAEPVPEEEIGKDEKEKKRQDRMNIAKAGKNRTKIFSMLGRKYGITEDFFQKAKPEKKQAGTSS